MNNLNSILIEGNLVRDPEYRTTPKGTGVSKISIACNRYFRQDNNLEKEVGFFDVESWGKLADRVIDQGQKGRGVRVTGRLKQERWQGKDGKAMARIIIVAEHVEFRPDFPKNQSPAAEGNGAEDYADEAEGYEVEAENLVPGF